MSFYRNEIPEDGYYRAPSRQHYPWHELEEHHPDGGMWSIPPADRRQQFIEAAELIMANPDQFRQAMRRVLAEWPRSASVALSNPSMNHKAWMGHAGCYLSTGSPEETTRLAWHNLDEGEQLEANQAAADVIGEWRAAHTGSQQSTLFDFIPSLRTFGGGSHA